MDEPCSALDMEGTRAIEELMLALKSRYTIVIVTHNMAQARRTSDECVFMLLGEARRAPSHRGLCFSHQWIRARRNMSRVAMDSGRGKFTGCGEFSPIVPRDKAPAEAIRTEQDQGGSTSATVRMRQLTRRGCVFNERKHAA